MIEHIEWLGHGSFRIQGPPLIYINPWRISRNGQFADAILVTDDEHVHCSPADIEKLRGFETHVVSNLSASTALGGETSVLRPWQCMNIGAGRITAVPAYTFNDYNPVSKGGLGFVISLDYYDIYYAGHTDLIPEQDKLRCDIAILPLSAGSGTLNLERTVDLVKVLQPRWVIPSHWGTLGGTSLDVQVLARALNGIAEVVMLEKVR
jgi:L-ascorbate metabolism protein UlaG (beta-lactamase superfamily)